MSHLKRVWQNTTWKNLLVFVLFTKHSKSKRAAEMKSAQLPVLALVYKEHQASHFAGMPVLKQPNVPSYLWLLRQELT